jgi:hypothetical protein
MSEKGLFYLLEVLFEFWIQIVIYAFLNRQLGTGLFHSVEPSPKL